MLRYEGAVAMIADAGERAKGEVAGAGFAVGPAAPFMGHRSSQMDTD